MLQCFVNFGTGARRVYSNEFFILSHRKYRNKQFAKDSRERKKAEKQVLESNLKIQRDRCELLKRKQQFLRLKNISLQYVANKLRAEKLLLEQRNEAETLLFSNHGEFLIIMHFVYFTV